MPQKGRKTRTTRVQDAEHRSIATGCVCIGLISAVLLIYGQVASHEFVTLDDPQYVHADPRISNGLTLPGLKFALTGPHASNWHPLTSLSHMLDSELFGAEINDAGKHLLVNVALHAVNAVLLFLVLARMTGAFWASALVAALFAVHPLRVESVAWLSERKDVLSGLFWIFTLLAYDKYTRDPRAGRYILVACGLALGLLAKPMVVTLPLVLLLLDVWPLRRLRFQNASKTDRVKTGKPASSTQRGTHSLRRLILEKVPLLVLAAASCAATVMAQADGGAIGSMAGLSFTWRLANTSLAYLTYVEKTIWPADLACFYPHPGFVGETGSAIPFGSVVFATTLLLVATSCVVFLFRRAPYLCLGWLWFLGTLVPVIGLVQVGEQALADRYTYLPAVGLYVAAAWGVRDVVARWPRVMGAVRVFIVAVLVVYATVAWRQAGTWKNSETLFRHALSVTQNNYLAHDGLGLALSDRGERSQAAAHHASALRINPLMPEANFNLGAIYLAQGSLAKARQLFERGLRARPGDTEARDSLAVVYARQKAFSLAVSEHQKVTRLKPDNPKFQYNFGLTLSTMGELDKAASRFERALSLEPDNAATHYSLGILRTRQRDYTSAIEHLKHAVRVSPEHAEAHNDLGVALASRGRVTEAVVHFERATRLRPGFTDAANNLARARSLLNP